MAYLGKTPSQAVRSRYYFTATGGETSLSGADDNSNTLTFTDGNYVDVALNGVTLVAGTDYNTTTANTIGGLTALVASDVVEIIVYDTFSVFSGNVNGDFSVGGDLTITGTTTTSGNINFGDNDKAQFGAGNDLQIYHDGSNSIIAEASVGSLKIQGSDLYLTDDDGTNMLYAANNGGVTLYQGGGAKLATTSTGVDITGTITVGDSHTIGDDADDNLELASSTAENIVIDSAGGTTVFKENATEVARLTGGSLGIGTTSPNQKLEVSTAGTVALRLMDTSTNYWDIENDSNLKFIRGGTETMRIDSSSRLLVGTSSTSSPFDAGKIVINTSGDGMRIRSGGTPMRFIASGTSTFVGSITTTASSTAYNTSSDYRLKENDVDMTGAITRVKQLQPKRFNFIADADDTTVDGFMAHEVQTVVPEAITGTHNEVDDDGNPVYQGIDQSKLVPLLTGALQEAIAKIETLEAKVTALENA